MSAFVAPFVHAYNQTGAMLRTVAARAHGLANPEQYGVPYPGSQTTTTTNNTGAGFFKPALLAALLMAGGGALAHVALKPGTPPVKTPQPAGPVVADPIGPPAGLWKQLVSYDGGKTWQEEQSQKATRNPDGTWSTPDGRKWKQDASGDWQEAR